MPEQMIKKLNKSILPQWKVCFISAVIVGFIAHLYKITNWLPNWDSLVFRYDPQDMLSMGRWFLSVVCAPSSFYDLPLVAGAMAIIFHALGAVCICRIAGVRKKVTAALIGAVVATFPTVTSVMMYNYVADGYALAFLLSCVAALLLTKDKPRYVTAAILIALSCGIYQAYITVTIVLLILVIMLELLYKKTEMKSQLLKCLRFLLTGAAGMVLYYLVLMLLLKLTGTTLLEYQGFDKAASFEGIDILGALYATKESVIKYFFDFTNGLNAYSIINCFVLVFATVLYVADVIKNKLCIGRIIMLVLCLFFLILGANTLFFINCSIDYHNLMKMGFVVFYLFLILQYERCEFKGEKLCAAKAWAILVVSLVLVFNQIIIANVSYHKLGMAYEKSYGTLVRIADRIEQTEGAEECDSILVLGHLTGSDSYSAVLPPDMTGTTDGYILRADDEMVGQSVLCSALNDYCGKDYKFISGEEKSEIIEKIDAGSLPIWPGKNSVCVADNVIVIKLGD